MKNRNKKGFISFLISLYRPFWVWTSIMILAMISYRFIQVFMNSIFKDIVDLISNGGFNVNSVERQIIFLCLIMVMSNLLEQLSHYARMVKLLKNQQSYIIGKLFNDLRMKSYNFFTNNQSGKISASITQVSSIVVDLNQQLAKRFVISMSALVSVNFFMYTINKKIFMIVFFYSVISVLVRILYFNKYWIGHIKNAEIMQRTHIGILNDAVTNIVPLKIYNAIKKYSRKVKTSKDGSLSEEGKANKIELQYYVYIETISNAIFIFFTMKYALNLYSIADMTMGELVFIFTTIITVGSAIGQLCWGYILIAECLVKLKSSYDLLYEDVEIFEENSQELKVNDGVIEFNDITFKYEKEKILNGFNLKISKGESLGIIGESGSGKTTLNNLLFRFYDPDKGQIKIDGQDIKEYSRESLYKNATYVPQETILLHTTIYENIKIAKSDATDEEIYMAAKKAEIHEFILDLPNGYDTVVGERGIKLSGGQRQRIALTRIFLRDSKIIVFDEATSALDNKTEFKVQDSIDKYFKDKTIICIAHRLSSLENMDRIIVLDKGKIVDEDKPSIIIEKHSKSEFAKIKDMEKV
ncbi:MAG: ABC transporter ATP-binding protein/permease [Clostridia bacterium]|nr:ABC transporter ATP-binding protein/permease [Clostridia bacterium]